LLAIVEPYKIVRSVIRQGKGAGDSAIHPGTISVAQQQPMTNRLYIRLAQHADLPLVERITNAAYANYLPVLGYPPVPVTEDYRPRINRGEVWLAEIGGAPIGVLVLERHPDHVMIFSVAVLPEHHRKGHGLALLRFAEDQGQVWGVAEARLRTGVLMTRNIALYHSLGYQETGRHPHPKRPEFIVMDMVKPLLP
jgi:ribosomal protein S18 acetylase RimI-like enzyme